MSLLITTSIKLLVDWGGNKDIEQHSYHFLNECVANYDFLFYILTSHNTYPPNPLCNS